MSDTMLLQIMQLAQEISVLQNHLETCKAGHKDQASVSLAVTKQDISDVVSEMTGIPVSKVSNLIFVIPDCQNHNIIVYINIDERFCSFWYSHQCSTAFMIML